VRRKLNRRGIIAAWCYSRPAISPAIDKIVEHYSRDILDGYWPERFRYVEGR
jgi:hypothetical protein